jgi:hypothetical protein
MLKWLRCAAKDCPTNGWDYDRKKWIATPVLTIRCIRILWQIKAGRVDRLAQVKDTRPMHRRMFRWLTPICFPHFAGHYRGAHLRCLDSYDVSFGGRQGTFAPLVQIEMTNLASLVDSFVKAVTANPQLPEPARKMFVASVVCEVLVRHQLIHPFANGNGHMGRFAVWSLLLHFGYVPKGWPLERRPAPPYGECIREYGNGNRVALERYVLQCL